MLLNSSSVIAAAAAAADGGGGGGSGSLGLLLKLVVFECNAEGDVDEETTATRLVLVISSSIFIVIGGVASVTSIMVGEDFKVGCELDEVLDDGNGFDADAFRLLDAWSTPIFDFNLKLLVRFKLALDSP